MAGICTKLRMDLEIRPESSDPGAASVVKDPVTRRFYRFTPEQTSVLKLLNGWHDPCEIALAVEEKSGKSISPSQVEDFIGNLRKFLLLDEPIVWKKLEGLRPIRRWSIRRLLQFKIHLVNPDAFLTGLEKRLAFCFRPAFQWASAGLLFLAVCVAVSNYEELFLSMSSLFTIYSVPVVLALAFPVMTIHEIAHGLALKHFGGKVHEMGLMVMYFIPAFYCNVDDAWMMPRKQRTLVTLAGGYAQILICALAVVFWRILAPETPASRLLVVVIAFSSIQTLFNFNPLIKLDGYYLLSDLLNLPNLRQKAFGSIKQLFMAAKAHGSAPDERMPERPRWIFLSYGFSAIVFTGGILVYLFSRLATWILSEYQTWGLVALSGILLVAVGIDKPAAEDPKAADGKKRFSKKWRPAWAVLILAAGSLLPWELKIAGDFVIVANQKVLVAPEVDGVLKTIEVREGQAIRAGQTLAKMENLELRNDYEETRGELASKKAELDLLRAGSRPEELERSRRLVETRRAELSSLRQVDQEKSVMREVVARKEAEKENAGQNAHRSRQLLAQGLISKADAERDETALKVADKGLSEALGQLRMLDERTDRLIRVKQKELEHAESELLLLRAGSRKESIRAAEEEVKKMDEKAQILARQISQLEIRSPIDGTVVTPYLQNRLGDFLNKGDVFCEIVSVGSVIVDLPVPEKEIADVRAGYPITLKVRGFPARDFEAKVKTISPVAIEKGSERRIVVQGELENQDGVLKAGMTGVGKILCGRRMILELISRRMVRWLRTEFWEYLP